MVHSERNKLSIHINRQQRKLDKAYYDDVCRMRKAKRFDRKLKAERDNVLMFVLGLVTPIVIMMGLLVATNGALY